MRGKIGVTMRTTHNLYGVSFLRGITGLSKEGEKRLKWFDYYHKTKNARLTCRYFGISPQTFYRWKKRFNPKDLTTLESKSSRPKKVRTSQISLDVINKIKELREQYPRWGKEKIAVLLRREGINVSVSTVGRVIKKLKERGVLKEPLNLRLARIARRKRRKPRYAIRKPKDYEVKEPGDLVEVDTLDIRLLPGQVRYQFSARDCVSRFDGMKVYSCQTSYCAAIFLEHLEKVFPFKIKAIQIDGGSEFKKEFEKLCEKKGIKLFELPPRSPKLNGHVERANRTHREEFYEVEEIELSLVEHNKQLARWEYIYNYQRPHQALDYLTPNEYYQKYFKKGEMCH